MPRPRGSLQGGITMLVASFALSMLVAAMHGRLGIALFVGGVFATIGLALLLPALATPDVRIGRDRVDCAAALGRRACAIELRSATIEARDRQIVVRDGARSWTVLRRDVHNFDEVAAALRARVRPEAWLPAPTGASRRPPARPASAPAAVGYRSSSAEVAALPAWCTTERAERRRRLALSGLMIAGGVLAFMLNPPPDRPRGARTFVPDERAAANELEADLLRAVAVALSGLGAFTFYALGDFAPLAAPEARRVFRWLGADPMPSGPRSARRGQRRVRVASRHASSRIGMAGFRREVLDAHDRTIATCRATGFATSELEGPLLLRSVAVLPRPFHSRRHYEQIGPQGSRPTAPVRLLGPARVLVLDVHADGVMLHRFSESRAHVGDTWHPTREHALSQIEDEYGERNLTFVDVPFDANEGPIAFFAHVELERQSRAPAGG